MWPSLVLMFSVGTWRKTEFRNEALNYRGDYRPVQRCHCIKTHVCRGNTQHRRSSLEFSCITKGFLLIWSIILYQHIYINWFFVILTYISSTGNRKGSYCYATFATFSSWSLVSHLGIYSQCVLSAVEFIYANLNIIVQGFSQISWFKHWREDF